MPNRKQVRDRQVRGAYTGHRAASRACEIQRSCTHWPIGERMSLPTFWSVLVSQAGNAARIRTPSRASRGHPYFSDGWHLSEQGNASTVQHTARRHFGGQAVLREHQQLFAYFQLREDFGLVISDSTLCVVEKEKAVGALSRLRSLATSPCAARRPSNAKEATVDASRSPLSPRRCIRRGARGSTGAASVDIFGMS